MKNGEMERELGGGINGHAWDMMENGWDGIGKWKMKGKKENMDEQGGEW